MLLTGFNLSEPAILDLFYVCLKRDYRKMLRLLLRKWDQQDDDRFPSNISTWLQVARIDRRHRFMLKFLNQASKSKSMFESAMIYIDESQFQKVACRKRSAH